MTNRPDDGRVIGAPRLHGEIGMPSDKSIAHRALICNALAGGPAEVAIRSPGRDVMSTVACLRTLGVRIDAHEASHETRFRLDGGPAVDGATLDCGNSGTTMRLLAGALAGLPLSAILDGDASLRRRPMERLAGLLRATGAEVTTTDGHAPVRVAGRPGLAAVTHRLPVASAQLLGACALTALGASGTTRIAAPGPTRDHTERLLAAMGVAIRRTGLITAVDGPARLRPMTLRVPGDPSSAAAWLVAAALHPDADLTLPDVCLNPTRLAIVDLLRRMGAEIEVAVHRGEGPEPVGELRVRSQGPLRAIVVGGDEVAGVIDELPLLAIAMAGADGESEVRDAGELRVKESDRIGAVVRGLRAVGAEVTELPDGWRIRRGTPRSGRIVTEGDHRIAIAFAVAALAGVAEAVEIDEPASASVSYPTFWRDLRALEAGEPVAAR